MIFAISSFMFISGSFIDIKVSCWALDCRNNLFLFTMHGCSVKPPKIYSKKSIKRAKKTRRLFFVTLGSNNSFTLIKATDWVFHTGWVCHVWCNFWPGYMCRTTCTIIFGSLKDSSLKINSLPFNNCFSNTNVLKNGVNT